MKTTESSYNQSIERWVLDLLGKPNPAFGNLPPCPYAKKEWLSGNVDVKPFKNFVEFDKDIQNLQKEVVIYYFDTIPLQDLQSIVKRYNKKYRHLLFYDEHPESEEKVAGVLLNSGIRAIIVQNRKELLEKREELMDTEYYSNWTDDLKEKIFDR